MKRNEECLFLVLGCFMFVAGGCAKNEVVKKEEPVMPTTITASKVKNEPVSKQQIAQASEKNSAALDKLEPISNAAELKAAMEKIYFDFDAYSLSAEARNALVKNSQIMKMNPEINILVEGHCDERGSAEYNLALGDKRAKAAAKYIATMGVQPERLSVISYGKERPAVQGRDEISWSKNRRDEFVTKK